MSTLGPDVPWAQILSELGAIRRDIADLRVDLATEGETSRNLMAASRDHESRLRDLEARDVVTPSELAARDERATVQRRWLIGIALTLLGLGLANTIAVVSLFI